MKPFMANGATAKHPFGAKAIWTGDDDGLVRRRVSSSQSRAIGMPIELQAAIMSGFMAWAVCTA